MPIEQTGIIAEPALTIIPHGVVKPPRKPWQPKDHRPIEQIKRDVEQAKEWLSRMRRELKDAVASARMRAQRYNPDFVARMAVGNRAYWANPENRARQAEIRRANCKGHPCHLPPLTDQQHRHYRKLRRILPREQALAGALLVEG